MNKTPQEYTRTLSDVDLMTVIDWAEEDGLRFVQINNHVADAETAYEEARNRDLLSLRQSWPGGERTLTPTVSKDGMEESL